MNCTPDRVIALRNGKTVLIGDDENPPRVEGQWSKPFDAVFCRHGPFAVLATAGGRTRSGETGINWTAGDVIEQSGNTVFTPNQLREVRVRASCDLFQNGRMIPSHPALQELLARNG